MRVGVIYGGVDETIGGGHALQATVAEAVKRANTGHELVLIDIAAPESDATNALRKAPAQVGPAGRLMSGVYRRMSRVYRRLAPPHSPAGSRIRPPQSALGRVVWERNLDVVWFLIGAMDDCPVPYFQTVWDLQHRLQPYFPEVSVYGWSWEQREAFYGRTLPRAAGILTGTEAGKAEIVSFYGVNPGNVHVIPLPLPDLGPAAGGTRDSDVLARYRLQPGYLYYPAQFWPHKNHVNLLLALDILRREHSLDLHLVLTGSDQGNRPFVSQRIAGLGLEDRVHMLGFVPLEDLAAIYRSALCLSYVSYFGPDNLPPLEAFHFGCPVIAARVPGAEEQLADGAMLVNPSAPEEIAAAIARLHRDPAAREVLVTRGRQRLVGRTGADYVAAMSEVLNGHAPIRRNWDIRMLRA